MQKAIHKIVFINCVQFLLNDISQRETVMAPRQILFKSCAVMFRSMFCVTLKSFASLEISESGYRIFIQCGGNLVPILWAVAFMLGND